MEKREKRISRVDVAKKYFMKERFYLYLSILFGRGAVKFLLIVFSVSVFFAFENTYYKKNSTFHSGNISTIASMFYGVISRPFYMLNEYYSSFVDKFSRWHYQEDVKLLVEQKISLEDKVAVLDGENKQLRQLAHFISTPQGFEFVSARVTKAIMHNGDRAFVINIGKKHGIDLGCIVTNETNIVGRVYEVDEYSSIIIPITEKRFTIPAIVLSTGQNFIATGAGSDRLMKIHYINNDNTKNNNSNIGKNLQTDNSRAESDDNNHVNEKYNNEIIAAKEGDLVVTYGQIGIIPHGITIGRIHFIRDIPFVKLSERCQIRYLVKIFFESKDTKSH